MWLQISSVFDNHKKIMMEQIRIYDDCLRSQLKQNPGEWHKFIFCNAHQKKLVALIQKFTEYVHLNTMKTSGNNKVKSRKANKRSVEIRLIKNIIFFYHDLNV